MRPLFADWLAPFRDLGVSTISIRKHGRADHLAFDAVGLPGFQFIQTRWIMGPVTIIRVWIRTIMRSRATLMQAAAVIASVVYDAAMRTDMLRGSRCLGGRDSLHFYEVK